MRKKEDIISDLQYQLEELTNSVNSYKMLAETYKRHQYLLLEVFANELITDFNEFKTFNSSVAVDIINKKKKEYLKPLSSIKGIIY